MARWTAPADGTEEVEGLGSKALPSPGSVSRKRQEPSNRTRKTKSWLSFLWVSVSIVVSLVPLYPGPSAILILLGLDLAIQAEPLDLTTQRERFW